MTSAVERLPASLTDLKRCLAETLARSKLDYTDDILILNAFFRDFRREETASPALVKDLWKKLLRSNLPSGRVFSVYLHVPYCAKKCHFCYCLTEISTNKAVIDAYVPDLKKEVDYFAPLFKDVPVRLFQVGGGTPNILSAAQLDDLLGHAAKSFKLEPDGMRVIEFNPAGTDPEKLAVVRKAGFNRISFGVQSLNPQVLERENREYQSHEMTRDAVRWAREAGFEIINVDLLLGLASDTPRGFLDGFRKIAELRPTTIIVPGVTLTDAYMNVMKTTRERNLRHYEEFLPPALEGMRKLAREFGYQTDDLTPNRGIWVLYDKDAPAPLLNKITRGDLFSAGALSVLGLGHHARSFLFGQAQLERHPRRFGADLPLYRMTRMTLKEEKMRYILYSLENHSRVDLAQYKERFGADFLADFSLELKALAALGKIRIDPDGAAFLPARGPERIFYGLFFLIDLLALSPFSRGAINASLRRRLQKELA